MTIERAYLVGLEPNPQLDSLVSDILSAAERARKADPGDRFDVIRFEALATQLEQRAASAGGRPTVEIAFSDVRDGLAVFGRTPDAWSEEIGDSVAAAARSLIESGHHPVLLVEALEAGEFPKLKDAVVADEPAHPWRSEGSRGREAVTDRFRAQIAGALDPDDEDTRNRAISPSGIQNPVVTEILRQFVAQEPGSIPRSVPIEYRDGSRSAHPFRLRSLSLSEHLSAYDLELRFALLSIRHMEMDATVHGAWLRNSEISRPRMAAQTDDLVYEISRTQLNEVTRSGDRRVRIHMFQTGLETAVVGFYKALTDHLLEHPESVAVQPMYYANAPRNRGRQGKRGSNSGRAGAGRQKGRNASRSKTSRAEVVTDKAPFKKGTPWSM